MTYSHNYIVYLQFLGFRFSGWQRQPGRKTVEGMIHKTLGFVLMGRTFKILGAGRTDSRVSALGGAFQLFLQGEPLADTENFLSEFNLNLPPDIRATKIELAKKDFNILNHCREKEYHYYFACGEKLHPFCAPFITGIPYRLDIPLMEKAAGLFIGTHNFTAYTTRKNRKSQVARTVTDCKIERNTDLKANFFPEDSYVLKIKSPGFARYQVRMIMGVLFAVGKGEYSLDDVRDSLLEGNDFLFDYVAPGSGLLLYSVKFS